jgi:hypothetical protein
MIATVASISRNRSIFRSRKVDFLRSFSFYPNALISSIGYGYGVSVGGGMGLSILTLDAQTGISIPIAYDPKFRNRTPT